MSGSKPINGFCPVQGKDYSVELNYMKTDKGTYLKGNAMCQYTKSGNLCTEKECPIWKSHPTEFN